MVARFTGPYQMPKGARGRVPRLPRHYGFGGGPNSPSGGLSPPMGAPKRFRAPLASRWGWKYWGGGYRGHELQKYGSGWAYGMAALANIDPASSRKFARSLDAGLAQWLPWQTTGLGDPFAGWGYGSAQPLTNDFPYDVRGDWTITCNFDSSVVHPTQPSRKVGITPGSPAISGSACNISAVGRANRAPGSDLPGGLTVMQLVQSSAGSPWPNQNGTPYFVANHPASPASKPLRYKVGTVVVPIADPMTETQMEPHPDGRTSTTVRLLTGYQTAAMTVTIPARGPPTKTPDDVHNRVPPGPREREEKPMDKTGRSVKEVYGAMTEIGDALDCMQKSLKKGSGYKQYGNLKRVPVSQRLDLKALRMAQAAASGQIDWGSFVECMAVNDFKDKVIGKLGGGAARQLNRSPYAPRGSAYRGYGVGGGSTRMR